MKILFYSTMPFEPTLYKAVASQDHDLHFTPSRLTPQTVHEAQGFDAICTFINDEASGQNLEQLAQMGIQYIATRSAGYDHINVERANELNIEVARVPGYSPSSIAEHSVMLMMALNRQLLKSQQGFDKRDYRIDELVGFDMNGRTAGIIGAGQIGQRVVAILRGFGCNVLVYDPFFNPEIETKYGAKQATLEEVFAQSDIISLHCPLVPENEYLIRDETIATMKDGVMIINTARGKLLHTAQVIKHVISGKIGYLGLDVYENEKGLFFFDHGGADGIKDELLAELRAQPNVIVTAHQAYLTDVALDNIVKTTLANFDAWQKGETPENKVGTGVVSPPRL